jgi:hypothetical protein
VARAVQVRLRFLVVLGLAFLVVGQWEALRNSWDRLTRAALGAGAGADQPAVSTDTEYFCPMDPGVVSDWPGKCGVCNMALVRRKKGDAAPLPSGVVARMQFSPYRLQLAGIRTSPVVYQPLAREVMLVGSVSGSGPTRTVEAEAFDRDVPFLAEGQAAEVTCDALEGHEAFAAKVVGLRPADPDRPGRARVRLEVDDVGHVLRPRMAVTARVRRPLAGLEPFRSMPADPPPVRKGEPRSVFVCPEHTEVVRDGRGKCPVDGKNDLEPQPLLDNQRVGWWCPMHPAVTAGQPGRECRECGGMKLVARVVTFRPSGQVLAVPESAVVDTGDHTVVYVERMPGMFDGVEVALGPRCGDAYAVVRGLEPGQRVATAGAFLIDAETRLNPSLAAGYFGAARGNRVEAARSEPAPGPDLWALAEKQRVCPVTGKRLGSMGPPVPVSVAGRTVLICCDGCAEALKSDPEKYLRKLP